MNKIETCELHELQKKLKESEPKGLVDTYLVHENASMPVFQTMEAACADVYLPEDVIIPGLDKYDNIFVRDEALYLRHIVKVPLGLIFHIKEGYQIKMSPRSSTLVKLGIMQPVSTIDSDYVGIVHVPLCNITTHTIKLNAGERIAQIEVQAANRAFGTDWLTMSATRGVNGFGSTGK